MTHNLIVDIGGTHARFAWVSDDWRVQEVKRFKTAEFPEFEDALTDLLKRSDRPCESLALAAAGPVTDGTCHLTNAAWFLDARAIAARFNIPRVEVINDLAAVAYSLPHLQPSELRHIAGPTNAEGAKLALGVGTGLGTALLVHPGLVVPAEGGHSGLSSLNAAENEILRKVAGTESHLGAERALAGQGLSLLYNAFAPDAEPLTPDQVFDRRNDIPAAAQAFEFSVRTLGRFAGDAVLMTGARGGLYLAGGVMDAWGEALDSALFHSCFVNKGRFRDYLEQVPVFMITAPDPAFLGLIALLRHG
jgi:glucokinase